jgi:uncharacterized protein YukE
VKRATKAKPQGSRTDKRRVTVSPIKANESTVNRKKAVNPPPVIAVGRQTVMPVSNARKSSMDNKPGGDDGDRNVDQIRDILFGGQMRDYERRFQEMIQKLDQETQRLRDDFERRSGAIEKRLDEQVDKLLKQLRQEVNDRGQSLDDLESRVQQSARTARNEMNNAVAALQQDLGQGDERLRAAMAEINAAIKQLGDNATSALGGARDELRAEKVSREDLAAMLTEVALRLKGHFDLPLPR